MANVLGLEPRTFRFQVGALAALVDQIWAALGQFCRMLANLRKTWSDLAVVLPDSVEIRKTRPKHFSGGIFV